jgi:ABC-type uncharacterized transport system substrate-binding protein
MAVLAGLLVASGPALSHPHVWVTMKSTVVYAPDGTVTGVRHAWTFDDMFSTFAVQGLESKQKGVFTRQELAPLAEVNVTSLKEYDYFTYAKANGKKLPFVDPTDYHLEFKDSMLTLHFMLPLKTPVKAQTLDLDVYDPSYFVEFALAKENPATLAGAPEACKLTIGKPQEMSREMARMLLEIPQDQQIPENSYGAQFANKITVKCP